MNLLKIILILASAATTLSAEPPRLVSVVYGESSLTSKSDPKFSFSRARSVFRSLDEAGVTSKLFSDKELVAALSSPCRVAHLVHLDMPSAEQLAVVDRFLASGGKLVVYYSSSNALARRMGLSQPQLVKAGSEYWEGFTFASPRLLNAPERVESRSGLVIETLPKTAECRVIAKWFTTSGKPGPAAVIQSPKGFWVTGVLTDADNASFRRKFLAALSADCSTEVWRHAAKRLDTEVWMTVGATSFKDAQKRMRTSVSPAMRGVLEEYLSSVAFLNNRKDVFFAKGLFGAAMPDLWAIKEPLVKAYAVANGISKGRGIVAVWERSGDGLFPGDWASTATILSKAGVTDLYLMISAPVLTSARLWGATETTDLKQCGARLSSAVKTCHRYGIRVHAWIPAFNLKYMTQAEQTRLAKDGRALVNATDKDVLWADPGNARNREELSDLAVWIAANCGVDGIHLDYIRFPQEQCAMGTRDRAVFENWLGRKVNRWPADVNYSGTLRPNYYAWRAFQITETIRIVREKLNRHSPGTLLSTAVYGKYPGCANSVGQDWAKWIGGNLVDYVVPMNYTDNAAAFKKMLEDQLTHAERSKIVAGIGVTSFEATLNAVEVLQQLSVASRLGIKGVALYHLDHRFQQEILPAMTIAE